MASRRSALALERHGGNGKVHRDGVDEISDVIEDRCPITPTRLKRGELYAAYVMWRKRITEDAACRKDFFDALVARRLRLVESSAPQLRTVR